MSLCQEQLKADRNRWKNIMFVHHQINNNSGINIIYKQSSTICIAKLLYTIMMLTVITLLAGCNRLKVFIMTVIIMKQLVLLRQRHLGLILIRLNILLER